MPTVVTLNASYEMVAHEITGGHYISKEEYEALVALPPVATEEQ